MFTLFFHEISTKDDNYYYTVDFESLNSLNEQM